MAPPEITDNKISTDDEVPDTLVPDPQVCREFGVCSMTLWRWDRDPTLNFPPPVKIRKRNYRSRRRLEETKERWLRIAFDARSRKAT